MKLALTDIKATAQTQMRVELNLGIAQEYAEAMNDAAIFPRMVVFSDNGDYWLADGFHRYKAYQLAGIERVEVDVKEGDLRDAVLYACGANSDHGLRRSNVDKKQAITTLLKDDEWGAWTDSEIARRCKVSRGLVAKYRRELSCKKSMIVKATRNGKTYDMDVSNLRVQAKPVVSVAVSPEVQDINETHGDGRLDVGTLGFLSKLQANGNGSFEEVQASGYVQVCEEQEAVHISEGAVKCEKALVQRHKLHRQLNPGRTLKLDLDAGLEDIAKAIMFAMPERYKELGKLLSV
jgi:hypothetical protein